jgi:hypothetical protein
MTSLIKKVGIFLAVLFVLTSCSDENLQGRNGKYQREYEQHFKTAMCIKMEVQFDRYRKDPLNNRFGLQGFVTKEEVLENLYQGIFTAMKSGGYAYGYPKDFQPNPKVLPYSEVAENCPELAAKFWQIPF